MKQLYVFSLAIICLLTLSIKASAQLSSSDSTYTQLASSPYYVKAQFAGGIGFVSAGVGRYFVQDKLEMDLLIGYLPKSIGGDEIVTSAIKATYVAIRPLQVNAIKWQPLRTGLQLSYTFGDEYYVTGPEDKYPKDYYGFSTALLLHLHIGGQLSLNTSEKLNKFALYYEFGSNSKYIASYAQSPQYLNPFKIFNLALGLRMKL